MLTYDRRMFLAATMFAGASVGFPKASRAAGGGGQDASISPFPIAIPNSDLADLQARLRRTRWPESATAAGWSQGVPLDQLRALCEYWRDQYDWRRCEAKLNALGSHRTVIDGLGFHFLHIRSPERGALPLLMTHGWPGSVTEFFKVIEPLTHPVAHGGRAEDAFHLVLPSLPGHGFSDKPDARGWDADRVAAAWIELIRRLGYSERWGAQGGDWGEMVAIKLGARKPEGLIGLHVSTLDIAPTRAEVAQADAAERGHIARAQRYLDELSGYAKQQATRPQTIGYALTDSPAGQAAWIYERFHDWTDNDGSPETILSRDEILDNIMMYWLPSAAASSARFYMENADEIWGGTPVGLPMAFSLFPEDLSSSSRRWAERRFSRIVYWNELRRGGHFAAMEQPTAFVQEVRAGFKAIRQALS